MKKILSGVVIVASIFFLSCGGPSEFTSKEMGVTFSLPSGWKASYSPAEEYVPATVDVVNEGRQIAIQEKGKDVTVADSLEMLNKAMKAEGFTSENAATSDNLFGGLYKKEGENSIIYYVLNKGGKTFKCSNGAYYDEKHVVGANSVCASLK